MSKRLEVEYEVTGRGSFPFDMLRYDRSFPAQQSDSGKMDDTDERTVRLITDRTLQESISQRQSEQRWASFGWKVNILMAQRVDR